MACAWTRRGSLIIGVWLMCGSTGMGQDAPEFVNARPVWENARGGAVSARRPGRMVQMGTLRFQEAHDAALASARSGPEITETAPLVDEGSALRAGLIAGFFDNLNSFLDIVSAAIGAGVGMPGGGQGGGGLPDLSDLLGNITGSSGG